MDKWDVEDSNSKKNILRTFVIAGLILIFVFSVFIYMISGLFKDLTADLCGNDLLKRVQQPGKNSYDLVYFRRDCGATTGYSYHLSIIKHGSDLKNDAGNIYTSKSEFQADWTDKSTIFVSSGTSGFRERKEYKGINIFYSCCIFKQTFL